MSTQLLHTYKSPELLLSKIQNIAWKTWEHMNNVLHGEINSYHLAEIQLIDKEIRQTWSLGPETIPNQYAQIFSCTLDSIFKKHTAKLKWLTTVWTLQEEQGQDLLQNTVDPFTRYRYMRWGIQIKVDEKN